MRKKSSLQSLSPLGTHRAEWGKLSLSAYELVRLREDGSLFLDTMNSATDTGFPAIEVHRLSAAYGDSMYAQSVLIADPDARSWQELPRALNRWIPEKQFSFCTRRDEALDRVANPASLFDVVISSAGFAESEHCFLLNGLKCLSMPLVITAGTSTLAASRRVLGMGAFGLIRLPVDGKRAATTLTLATQVKDIQRRTTVYHDLLNSYRERLAACPREPELEEVLQRCQVVFEHTYDMWRDTILHLEQSLRRLALGVVALQEEARVQAYAQLLELAVTKAA